MTTTVKEELIKMRKRMKSLEDRVSELEGSNTNVDDLKEQIENTQQRSTYKTFGNGAAGPTINSGKTISVQDAMQQHRSIFKKP